MLGNLGYFHDDPYSISLTYYSIAQGSYFNGGASFIKGGSQKLSDHLADYIRRHEGSIILGHIVTGIVLENNRPSGITYKRTRGSSSVIFTASASEIIANTAIPNVVKLLPDVDGRKLGEEIRSLKPRSVAAYHLLWLQAFSKRDW